MMHRAMDEQKLWRSNSAYGNNMRPEDDKPAKSYNRYSATRGELKTLERQICQISGFAG